MLQSLHVHNFALIEDAKVDFSGGFTVFTGETGAGKSILIDAFGIALGGRAAAGMVRTGADAFWVQKRRVTAAGKSQSSVNGIPVPLAVLKQFAELLVDIHGQHENQLLLQPKAPRFFTDAFGGEAAEQVLEAYRLQYETYEKAKADLEQLEEQGSQRERLLDRLAWVIQEISEANIKIGEEEALKDEAKLLQNSGKIMNALQKAYGMLEQDNGALSQLAEIREQIGSAARYDNRLQAVYDGIDSAWKIRQRGRSGAGLSGTGEGTAGTAAGPGQPDRQSAERTGKNYSGADSQSQRADSFAQTERGKTLPGGGDPYP